MSVKKSRSELILPLEQSSSPDSPRNASADANVRSEGSLSETSAIVLPDEDVAHLTVFRSVSRNANDGSQIETILGHHRSATQLAGMSLLHRMAAGRALAPIWKPLPHGQRDNWIKANVFPVLCRRTIERYIEDARVYWPRIKKLAIQHLRLSATEVSQLTPEYLLALGRDTEVLLLLKGEKKKNKPSTDRPSDNKFHWRTPVAIVTAVERYLEVITVDVAAEACGPYRVPAKQHMSKQQDAMTQPWEGNVYACPPWTEELPLWAHQARLEVAKGRAQEVVLLLPALFDVQWSRALSKYPRAFLHERLPIELPDGTIHGKLPHAAMIVAISEQLRLQSFAECFQHVADIFVPFPS